MPVPSTLDIALAHLAEFPDVFLFPIQRGRKTPPLIVNNLDAASNDPEQIKRWHTKWPGCGWGVALKKSHLLVVDVDQKDGKSGAHTYAEIGLLYEWPSTRTVRSPSGGLHHWYSGKHIFALGKNGFGPDVDSPNYVLMPGVVLADGTYYELIDDAPIAEAPDWFYEEYLRDRGDRSNMPTEEPLVDYDKKPNIDWAIHYLKFDAPPSDKPGASEVTTLKVAMELRDHGISEMECLGLMNEYYNVVGTCDPQWEIDGEHGLRRKVNNAYTYANLNAPGEKTAESEFGDSTNPFSVEEQEAARSKRQLEKAESKVEKDGPTSPIHSQTISAMLDEWVWIVGPKRWLRRSDGLMWDMQSFDSRYNYLVKNPSISKYLFKTRQRVRRYDQIVFSPGHPEVIDDLLYNIWRPSDIVPKEGDTSLWREHLEYLLPDEADRNLMLDWIAWVYQNQDKKPKHALLLLGETHGTGKSWTAQVLERLIGKDNTQRPKNSSLKGDFNGWALHCKLAIIEELMQIGRREVANELRDIITETTIEINIKNVAAFKGDNTMAMFAISNHTYDALPLETSDRRWLVIRTDAMKHDDADTYYTKLFGALTDDVMLSAIAYELLHRDLGDYSALGNAPPTEAKATMISSNLTDVEHWLMDMRDAWPLNSRVLYIPDVIGIMPAVLTRQPRLYNQIVSFVRRYMKGVDLGQRRMPGTGQRHRMWAINEVPLMVISEPSAAGLIYQKDLARAKAGAKAEPANDDDLSDFNVAPDE